MQKVLIITYYWPPAGGPGVQRWLKFVKYLREFNIEPVVYIPENPSYPIVDESFQNEISDTISIYRHKIFEPYRLAGLLSKKKTKSISSGIIENKQQPIVERLLLWVRGNFFIPDARKYWVKPSVNFLNDVIKKEGIETVITTGPPHSVHLIGHQLKKKLAVNWVADFRDPWTSIGYHKKLKLSVASQKKHKKLERLVLNTADSILVTSSTTKTEFSTITDKPIHLITNGYDEVAMLDEALDSKFTLAHIGSLLAGRNPLALWEALSELISEHADLKDVLEIKLAGVVSKDVLNSIYSYGLESVTTLIGYVSHEKALELMHKSQGLLLIEIDSEETKGIIPGKLFEYMAANRPVLGIGPAGWDVTSILAETKHGNTFTYTQKKELKALLLEWYKAYKQNKLHVTKGDITAYSRKELTKKLAAHLHGYSS